MGVSNAFGGPPSRQGVTGSSFGRDSGLGFGASQSSFVSEVGEHVTTSSSVKEYAYSEDKNYRFRPQMEDSKFKKLDQIIFIISLTFLFSN